MKIRCVTFNLKGIGDHWFEEREKCLIEGLRKIEPDIVCFQETTIRRDSPLYNQARNLGRQLGLQTSLFCPYGNLSEIVTRDQGGVALVSRWPALDVRARRLVPGHQGESDSRSAIFATIAAPGGEFGVAATHLSWRPNEAEIRLVQNGIIMDDIRRADWNEHDRFILMGDFNATEDEPAVHVVLETMKDVYRECHPGKAGYTWSSTNSLTKDWNLPDRRIDYIFCSKSTRIVGCDVVLNQPQPCFPSDHFGVMADLEWGV